ncbi:phosphoribosylformylglycinamidine synthase subunit PurQ [Roseospira marina]|uniref:Phosphoribosylformylglycinamidine synthase subunit PurQ n=1 Tax=Roseospira marina TaxID=140057 RepID=A0A5M6IEC7_9PROT|nr:phosphoribosylformylglycinamidine synthase subunit PurQ [Roseospira marina]KAA5606594.1 phosphoribosylformylglycinamidine synthase subunit PurQ [Roseospira marina]MBB4314007.1 phosphoribosylformylglycinamidine synthase [Roseospira marina]MBB5087169.1 phosphoribosylformylglycinamidine synthase [Roseospira marina]
MKAAVIVFPGSNCDRDVAVSLERTTGRPPLMHWHADADLPEDLDLIVIPGGFSYGDYLRSGAMAARSAAMAGVRTAAAKGRAVLGICNGFQVLCEAGLLPGALMRNRSLHYICRDVYLRVETTDSIFTGHYAPAQVARIPIAHHDGNYVADLATHCALEDEDRIAFRYCTPAGKVTDDANPNGSLDNIAGILSEERNVLGLMPHPERLADPRLGGTDGQPIFASLMEALS